MIAATTKQKIHQRPRMVSTVAIIVWLLGVNLWCTSCDDKTALSDDSGEDTDLIVVGGGGSGGGSSAGGVSSRAIALPPKNLSLQTATTSALTINWDDQAANELIFEVESCKGAACTGFAAAMGSPLSADTETFTLSNLDSGAAYRLRIRAVNKNGASTWLESTDLYTLLPALTNLQVTSTAATSAALSWTATTAPYTQTEIQRCSGDQCTDFRDVFGSPFSGALTSHTESGLAATIAYRFRVRAGDGLTYTTWSETNTVYTVPTVAAPTSLQISNLTDRDLGLTWTDNSAAELLYEVQKCSGSGCTNFAAATSSPLAANATTYSATDLSPSTVYKFRVRATGGDGSSDWAVTDEFTTGPSAPTALTQGTVTSASIALSWTDNASDETGYEVQSCVGSTCTNFANIPASPLAANTASTTVNSLSGGSTYKIRVRAVKNTSYSAWLTSSAITTNIAAASCASPTTTTVDKGTKTNSTNVGRGLWSDVQMIPGTRQPAVAYYDGSATGGTQSIKISWWTGSAWRVETVAGDARVAAGSATWVRLGFLSNGKPIVIWSTGATIVKGAMRSAALSSTGTWTASVLDTVTGGLSRAAEIAVSPADHVGISYLTSSAATGRTRFIYCPAGCSSITSFVAMSAGTDTIDNTNIVANFLSTGIGWCKVDASTWYPAIVYPGNGGTAGIRYSTCRQSDLANCRTAAGWTSPTTIVSTAGTIAKLHLDASVTGDEPKVVTRNAGNTLLQAFKMAQACNTAPAYSFTAGNTMGAANNGNAWLNVLKASNGTFHVVSNLSTTNVQYINSLTTNFATTTWNTAASIDTLTGAAGGSTAGGAAINDTDKQIYASFGSSTAPFNLHLGVVNDYTLASNSASASFYTLLPDTNGNIALPTSGVNVTRNVQAASTADGYPGVVYVDYSLGAAAASPLKYAYRSSLSSSGTWGVRIIPGTSTPTAPSLAFDHNGKPWIGYYDAANFKYYLVTNSAADGSGDWSFFQFPVNGKTATATAPATDETAVVMSWSSGVAKPVLIVLNGTAAGGSGVRAAKLDPTTGVYAPIATIDALGASFGTSLSAASSTNGTMTVAYYDITATRMEVSTSDDGLNWLATPVQVSTATTGREGVSVAINPSNGRPAVSYYDRANNTLYYARCTSDFASCSAGANWTIATAATGLGISGITATTYEHVLNSQLTFDSDGVPYIGYLTGIAASPQIHALTDYTTGSFVSTTLNSVTTSTISGASVVNYAMTGLYLSGTRTSLGEYVGLYVGPNNWLYSTSCGAP